LSAESVNTSKTGLAKFWSNQEIIYMIITPKFKEKESKVNLEVSINIFCVSKRLAYMPRP